MSRGLEDSLLQLMPKRELLSGELSLGEHCKNKDLKEQIKEQTRATLITVSFTPILEYSDFLASRDFSGDCCLLPGHCDVVMKEFFKCSLMVLDSKNSTRWNACKNIGENEISFLHLLGIPALANTGIVPGRAQNAATCQTCSRISATIQAWAACALWRTSQPPPNCGWEGMCSSD